MKSLLQPRALALLFFLQAVLPVAAARISEPGTTFYGRILTRVGQTEFPVTEGELTWTLVVPNQDNREYTLKARLEPFGKGQFQYRLVVPHQVLAFDLSVQDRQIPLTAAGWKMRHVKVRVNSQEAVLVAPATDSFTAMQSTRASVFRIDLLLPTLSVDSDSDGYPDWWEDQQGTDKWNPKDVPATPSSSRPGVDGNSESSFTAHSFAEWQRHFFPDSQADPATFARQDSNGDGIPHLLEYAFDLDPRASAQNSNPAGSLPRPVRIDGRLGIAFRPRDGAQDLDYQVEVSGDLVRWASSADLVERAVLPPGESSPGDSAFAARPGTEGAHALFLRVRVSLK